MKAEYVDISSSHPKYPRDLIGILGGAEFYALGAINLLGRPAIGICGSRNASAEAHKYALRFGAEAARHGLVVVSGYARGVDRQAHKGALEAGGATIAVLPEGITHFRLLQELGPLVRLDRNFLAVSMFEPDAVWKPWRAMERNKLIVGLSKALFVIEARETGGTINAAMECVHQHKPLWAIAYSGVLPGREGNQKLIQSSAIPLTRQSDLESALEDAMSRLPEEIRQLALNLP